MKTTNMFYKSILLLPFLILFGCSDANDKATDENSEETQKIVITMIAKSSSNPVFLSAKNGAISEAKKISEKYSKMDVVIDWKTPDNEDPLEQIKFIRQAVKDGTDAIIVSCSDTDSLTSEINKTVDAGIPVMTFDSDALGSKRFSFYGPDDLLMGEGIMNKLAELIDGKGKIAILGGNKTAPNLQERVKGVIKAASNYKDIEIVGEFYHSENETDAVAEMLRVQQQYPDLKGWAMVGGWALFGKQLLGKIEPGKIKIVAVDALPVQLEYVEKNIAQVLFGQPTYRWGSVSVQTVIEKIYLKKEVNDIIRLNTIPVTIENLGGWSRQLKAWGYTEIPEKYFSW